MPRPKYVVRVLRAMPRRAKEQLGWHHRKSILWGEAVVRLPEETGPAMQRTPNPWNLAAATVEHLAGEDPGLAQLLEDCCGETR